MRSHRSSIEYLARSGEGADSFDPSSPGGFETPDSDPEAACPVGLYEESHIGDRAILSYDSNKPKVTIGGY